MAEPSGWQCQRFDSENHFSQVIFRFLILCVFFANRVVFYAILVGFHRYHGVTHVFVNDPTRGYGIFAENMDNTLLTVAAASQSRAAAPAA